MSCLQKCAPASYSHHAACLMNVVRLVPERVGVHD